MTLQSTSSTAWITRGLRAVLPAGAALHPTHKIFVWVKVELVVRAVGVVAEALVDRLQAHVPPPCAKFLASLNRRTRAHPEALPGEVTAVDERFSVLKATYIQNLGGAVARLSRSHVRHHAARAGGAARRALNVLVRRPRARLTPATGIVIVVVRAWLARYTCLGVNLGQPTASVICTVATDVRSRTMTHIVAPRTVNPEDGAVFSDCRLTIAVRSATLPVVGLTSAPVREIHL
jgi:hypothetical protein